MNANKIRDLAKEKRCTLKELADYLGMTEAGLQHIMRNGSTGTTTLERIAEFFKVSPAVFFDDTPVTQSGAECQNCKIKDTMIKLLEANIADLRQARGSNPYSSAANG